MVIIIIVSHLLQAFSPAVSSPVCGMQVMNGGTYVSALLQLTQHPSEAVIRRALKLLTASLAKLGQQDARPTAEIADDASQGSAEAALELCKLAPTLLQTGSPSPASCSAATPFLLLLGKSSLAFTTFCAWLLPQCHTLRAVSSMLSADLPLLLSSKKATAKAVCAISSQTHGC